MKWYLKCLRQYADFSGRARRREYWFFVLWNCLVAIMIGVVGGLILTLLGTDEATIMNVLNAVGGLYNLAVLIPALAVLVRRLHDTGRSGWKLLFGFIPFIGPIIVLVFLLQNSEEGSNYYGANPKTHYPDVPEEFLQDPVAAG